MTGFSASRENWLGSAISTATSPLRQSFAEVNCRSPLTPRRDAKERHNLNINIESARYSNSTYLPTPKSYYITALPKESSYHHEDISPSTTLISPSSSLYPPLTPSLQSNPSTEKLGTFSAINLILGKTVGVGIYSIPSSILLSVGSVGASLTLWLLGSLISFCGLAVYLDLGTGIPKSGGERVYLERVFKRPYMLASCAYGAYVVLLGFSTPNCIVLGEYVLYALEIDTDRWNVRSIAVGVITLICVIHARFPKLGLRIINVLGVGKILILLIVILSGFAGALMGIGSSHPLSRRRLAFDIEGGDPRSTAQRNFASLFAGSSHQPYDYATALLKILYCFRGYSTANTILSDLRSPIPTLRVAAPVALSLVSILYLFVNISYFLIIPLSDFKTSGTVIAGHFFKIVFGEVVGENILPVFIIVSAFGNIAATSYAQARVNQELGRDGLLPFPSIWTRSKTEIPTAGLFLHWLVSVLVIIIPPPGEIYEFLVDIGGYPVSVISVAISFGLLYLQTSSQENWSSPFRAKKIYILVFALSNCLLLVLPWIKPKEEKGDARFRYYAYPATALAILGSGGVYWGFWRVWGEGREKWREGWHKRAGSGVFIPMMSVAGDEHGNEDDYFLGDDMRRRAKCGCLLDAEIARASRGGERRGGD